jgi:peptidylprolyl isomerase/FKBP-type peptidyl-prolyl cis-trans isomerase SlyD
MGVGIKKVLIFKGKRFMGAISRGSMQPGDIVRVEYEGWDEESGDLFDTTDEEKATSSGIYKENKPYGAVPVILGKGMVVAGFEKSLLESEVGEEKEVIVDPKEGFGVRDPNQIKIYPIREFLKRDIEPVVGMTVDVRRQKGTVLTVMAGRVRVDHNPPLAGRRLRYKFKIVEKVCDPVEKIRAIIEAHYPTLEIEELDVEMDEERGEAKVVLPDICKYDQRWFILKSLIVEDLLKYGGLRKLVLIEEYAAEG